MKIVIFGCSWSVGVPRKFSELHKDAAISKPCDYDFCSWAKELADLHPEHQITNYALPSSDLTYSVAMLNRVLKNQQYDKVIFQVTIPHRFTYWNDVELEKHFVDFGNYRRFGESILTDVFLFNPQNADDGTQSNYKSITKKVRDGKFIKDYLERDIDDRAEANHKALTYYAKDHSDFCFSHIPIDFLDIPNVEEKLGTEQFKTYVCDDGLHFGDDGNKWQAKWISQNLNL